MKQGKFFYGYIIVAACFLILFTDGAALTTVSVFIPEFIRDLGISYSAASIIFVLGMITGFVGGLTSSWVIPVLTPRWSVLVGTICLALSSVMNAIAHTAGMLYAAAVVAGLAMSLTGSPVVGEFINIWFNKKRSFMVGIAFAGSALGTAFWMVVHGFLIQHIGWRGAQFVMAAACMILCGPIPLFILKTPSQVGQEPYGEPDTVSEKGKAVQTGPTFREVLRTSSCWMYLGATAILSAAMFGYQYYVVAYFQLGGMSAQTSSALTGFTSFLRVFMTLLIGKLLDRKRIWPVIVLSYTSFIVTIALLLLWGGTHIFPIAVLSCALVSLAQPMYYIGASSLLPKLFGTRSYVSISSVSVGVGALFSAVSSYMLGYIQDTTGDMGIGFIIIAAPVALAMILMLLAFRCSKFAHRENKTNTVPASFAEQAETI